LSAPFQDAQIFCAAVWSAVPVDPLDLIRKRR